MSHRKHDNKTGEQWQGHGGRGVKPPHCPRGHSRDLRRTNEKILGYPPRNVVHANTLVLVAHLVTFQNANETSFTPGLKSLQRHGASLDPRQLLCPWTPLGTPLHTPHHVSLVSHLLQNSARTNSQNDHLICYKSLHL